MLRELTRERRSPDDCARAFFGTKDKSYDVITYTFDDVLAGLNGVAPYDWKAFLRERLDGHGPGAPLDGLARSGWQLVYRDEQSAYLKSLDDRSRTLNLSFSLGLAISTRDRGNVTDVVWDSPAFKAGLTSASKLIAVNGQEFTPELLLDAVRVLRRERQLVVAGADTDGVEEGVLGGPARLDGIGLAPDGVRVQWHGGVPFVDCGSVL